MLVLSRKKDESIIIGDSINVVVVDIRGDKIRLGISSPSETPVYRSESPPSDEARSFRAYGGDPSGMIVFSRKKNESVCIGNDIEIVVVDIRGDKVRFGIEFPKDVAVHRQEVYDAIKTLEVKQELNKSLQKKAPQPQPKSPSHKPTNAPQIDDRGIEIYIDPSNASKETIQEVLECLSELHIAAGGLGLEFVADDMRIQSMEGIVK